MSNLQNTISQKSMPTSPNNTLQLTAQSAPSNEHNQAVAQRMSSEPVYCYVAGLINPKVESDSIAHAFRQLIQGGKSTHLSKNLNEPLELTAENLYPLLCLSENRHLAREIEWFLDIDGADTYQLVPASEACLNELISSLSPKSDPLDLHIAVGKLSEELVGFQKQPKLLCEHIMYKPRKFLMSGINEALKKYAPNDPFEPSLLTHNVVEPILSHTHNLGINDAERALNYACWNYPDIYAVAYKMLNGGFDHDSHDPLGFTIEDVFYEPYKLQGQQQIYQIVFEFKGNSSELRSRWFCRVDVSIEYPTLQQGMTRYFG
ncbi:hypothetical protein [Marinomonas balearica]|uniref:PatG domain-containing protein n=1 Tax=Marinomonas balearica TaxID=491947 RepID=A0A4R6M627_9GAMM|nr:hypothetical protein [Marinomonas balearica]TDO96714.1 hypothetical protein DFP79_2479 [Marinomonas balearica]